MTSNELRQKFIKFFIEKGHKEIPSASLIPDNDPTTLFISAGMHPLVPYLLGEPHPLGKRLCGVQKCLRTGDIDEVGDCFHLTFFEMLGNWSLGDYWKEEMIPWSFEFLTKVLNIPIEKILVTCFAGDKNAPKDEETAKLWEKVGIPKERIYFLGKEDNWWGPAGKTGPCGPDSEMFYDTGKEKCSLNCRPGCSCGKYFEIWNDVFMEYNKQLKVQSSKLKVDEGQDFEFIPLKQKNIDTGMGVERTITILNRLDDAFRCELLWPIIEKIQEVSGKNYEGNEKPMRIIADHLKAAIFLVADGVEASNKLQGYVLRRLIRRSVVKMIGLNIVPQKFIPLVSKEVFDLYNERYFNQARLSVVDLETPIRTEADAFLRTLDRGTKILQTKRVDGKALFDLYQTDGFPLEVAIELLKEWGKVFDEKLLMKDFEQEKERHQELSRTASAGIFKAGLADNSEIATKYHTATHLLHAVLRQVLGDDVHQAGSNITAERLRFDFTYPEKLTDDQIKKVEEIVNQKINQDLPVTMEIMSLEEAKERGALAFFEQKYGEQIKVYSIGEYSKEVCGGPHVSSTGKIRKVNIIKEESCGAGKRRIYATFSSKLKVKS